MLRLILVCVALSATTFGAFAQNELQVTGREAEAIQLATKVFKSKQGSHDQEGRPVYGDLHHYTVLLKRQKNQLEIVFLPDEAPHKPNEAETGGSTVYGWEVHYVVALDRMKILEEHYAR